MTIVDDESSVFVLDIRASINRLRQHQQVSDGRKGRDDRNVEAFWANYQSTLKNTEVFQEGPCRDQVTSPVQDNQQKNINDKKTGHGENVQSCSSDQELKFTSPASGLFSFRQLPRCGITQTRSPARSNSSNITKLPSLVCHLPVLEFGRPAVSRGGKWRYRKSLYHSHPEFCSRTQLTQTTNEQAAHKRTACCDKQPPQSTHNLPDSTQLTRYWTTTRYTWYHTMREWRDHLRLIPAFGEFHAARHHQQRC